MASPTRSIPCTSRALTTTFSSVRPYFRALDMISSIAIWSTVTSSARWQS